MELILNKKPKNPIIVQGFPGLGLVGTISTEFLIEHLKMKMIGYIKVDEIMPLIAIHDESVVQPIGIYHDDKSNILVMHVVANLRGVEWKLADSIMNLSRQLSAKEVISLEGVGSNQPKDESQIFYVTAGGASSSLAKVALPLKEGVVVGVSAAMLVDKDAKDVTCFFAETHSNLPDSKAAAKLIEALDKYLGLKVDPAPLPKQAEQFEEKLKKIMAQSQKTQEVQESKEMSYLG